MAIVQTVRGNCSQMMHITCNQKADIMKTVKPEMLSKQTLRCVCYWTLPHRRPFVITAVFTECSD